MKQMYMNYTILIILQEFVTTDKWVHLDIAGVMSNTNEVPYLGKGMSGKFLFSIYPIHLQTIIDCHNTLNQMMSGVMDYMKYLTHIICVTQIC